MAQKVLWAQATNTQTIYFNMFDSEGNVYDKIGANFEVWTSGQGPNYANTMSVGPASVPFYMGDIPAVASGVYWIVVKQQAGATPVSNDPVLTQYRIDWDGTRIVPLASRLAPTVEGRTLDVTGTGNAGIDWGNIESPTATVNLENTNIGSVTGLGTALAALGTDVAAIGTILTDRIDGTTFKATVHAFASGVEVPVEPAEVDTEAIVAAVMGEVMEATTGLTFRQYMQAIMAVEAGEPTIGEDGLVDYRLPGNTQIIVTGKVDSVGNRFDVAYFPA